MPGVDGLEVLSRLKTLAPDTAVIVMTAHGSVRSAVEAMQRGRLRLPHQAVRQRRGAAPGRARALGARARARGRRAPDGDPGGVGVRRARRQVGPDAGGLQDHRPDRRHRRDRPPARGVGDGQGGRRARDPPLQPAGGQALRGRLLRGDPGDPPRVRALRPRARRVHGRPPAPPRPLRAGAGRHDVPRRGRGPGAGAPAQAPAGAPGAAARAGRRRRGRSPSTSASSRRRTATWRRSSGTDASARTSTTA